MSRFLSSKIFTGLLVILAGWLALSSINLGSQRSFSDREIQSLKDKTNKVDTQNSYLNKLSSYFQSANFLEKQARLKLNYKASGEEVTFVYKDTSPKNVSNSADLERALKQLPNYQKWWYWLWGY